MFITLLVLLCFNLLGEGFEVALPRIFDTLIGCAIAWAAVSFIWPDWKFRNLPRVLDRLSTPTADTSMPFSSNITRDAITAWPIALPAAMPIAGMANWHPWYQTCRRNRGQTQPCAKRHSVYFA
jgi:hypothetical protein